MVPTSNYVTLPDGRWLEVRTEPRPDGTVAGAVFVITGIPGTRGGWMYPLHVARGSTRPDVLALLAQGPPWRPPDLTYTAALEGIVP